MRKRPKTLIAIVFTILFITTFLAWPVEKADYSHCGNNLLCGANFKTEPGGGIMYLRNPKAFKDSDQAILKIYDVPSKQLNYTFSPIAAAAIASLVATGGASIAFIALYKLQIRKKEQ